MASTGKNKNENIQISIIYRPRSYFILLKQDKYVNLISKNNYINLQLSTTSEQAKLISLKKKNMGLCYQQKLNIFYYILHN